MKWNKDGSTEYNPEDITGTDDPDEAKNKIEANIEVTVTVSAWTEENIEVEVQ